MRRLPTAKAADVLHHLVHGCSLASTAVLCRVSENTVAKLLLEAGAACTAFHTDAVRGLHKVSHIQIDEIWAFIYCKQGRLPTARKPPKHAGDSYTWLALDSDSRFLISWLVGDRDQVCCDLIMNDVARRVPGHVQISTDGLPEYRDAVGRIFGNRADYAQLMRRYATRKGRRGRRKKIPVDGERRYSAPRVTGSYVKPVQGSPDLKAASTAFVERVNLDLRMQVKRYGRMVNAFSKERRYLSAHTALWVLWHNYIKINRNLRVTPAMQLGLARELREIEWIADLLEINRQPPAPRGSRRRQQGKPWRDEWRARHDQVQAAVRD